MEVFPVELLPRARRHAANIHILEVVDAIQVDPRSNSHARGIELRNRCTEKARLAVLVGPEAIDVVNPEEVETVEPFSGLVRMSDYDIDGVRHSCE